MILKDVNCRTKSNKKIKGGDNKDKKSKSGTKKRELKLTVSRALSDEIELEKEV